MLLVRMDPCTLLIGPQPCHDSDDMYSYLNMRLSSIESPRNGVRLVLQAFCPSSPCTELSFFSVHASASSLILAES